MAKKQPSIQDFKYKAIKDNVNKTHNTKMHINYNDKQV